MRRDMFKVIVERPRTGGNYTKKGRSKEVLRRELDDAIYFGDDAEAPRTKSPIRDRTYDRKHLNENLSPLRRFLRSKVGEHWDNVYSEVREHLNPDSTVQKHVVDHLKQYVVVDTCIKDGIVGHYPKYWSRSARDNDGFESLEEPAYYRDQFYVHPETKILSVCLYKKRSYNKTPTHEVIQVDEFHQYRKINDIWYLVVLEYVSIWEEAHKGFLYSGPPDCVFDQKKSIWDRRAMSPWQRKREYGSEYVYAKEKRQCGRRELKEITRLLGSKK